MIKLYSHNQKAYDLAVNMLKDTKKAAIVHPTGTGKSFVKPQTLPMIITNKTAN